MLLPSVEEVQQALGDRYEVLDLVGAGGMGAVFRARHRALGHLVAVKILPPEVAASPMRPARFKREAALAAHLTHPHIVPVFEFDAREGMAFLIMPFVRGRTLDEILRTRRPLPLAEVRRLLRHVGQALHFAHLRGVVHRDVKPANILVEEESGRALITDFGIAHVERSDGDGLTAPGAPIGTPDYMAPEQREGLEQLDGRADLYSLALVVFEALTGTRPSPGADRRSLARTLWASHPEVSARLATALVAPLATRPTERPASAAAWLEHIERSAGRRWPLRAAAAAGGVALAVAAWLLLVRPGTPTGAPTIAVVPFAVLSGEPGLGPTQLTEFFVTRFTNLPNLRVLSAPLVAKEAQRRYGAGAPSPDEADSLAADLGAAYYLLGSAAFSGTRVTLTATLHRTGTDEARARGQATGSPDSLSTLMDAVWAQALQPVVGQTLARTSAVTLPTTLPALVAYANAEDAFRRGDYRRALDEYDRVVALDSTFAIAQFRRALVIAQIDPSEERFREAIAGARRSQRGLSPADSLLLAGYLVLVELGDGRAALERFRRAAELAPDQAQVWLVLGEFYYHFGVLFDQPITEAERAFRQVLDLVPDFAPAISHLMSLTLLRGDQEATRALIRQHQALDSTSVIAEAVGIADTLLFGSPSAQRHLIYQTLDRHSFLALAYLAFQAAEFGTTEQQRGPARRILAAVGRRAVTDSQRALALRLGVAADLRAGWADSARLRFANGGRAAWAVAERDAWVLLARVGGLDSLGSWREAGVRTAARIGASRGREETNRWLLARLGGATAGGAADALRRAAADSAPLAVSLSLDLDARRALAAGDSARAVALWARATQRYDVLGVPFGLVASLWPLRLDLARVALARGDSAEAERACASFSTLMGYVDQVAEPRIERVCAPWRAPPAGP